MPVVPARNLLLSVHVLASVGWAGALAVFLAHALASLWTDDSRTAAALGLAMGITAWVVILPLAIASFATGVAQSLLSAWGLLRHHWVVFKLALTSVATIVLLLKLGR
jgi:DMSO/TMAO reductase YedYZ heme-binding membrane subunit